MLHLNGRDKMNNQNKSRVSIANKKLIFMILGVIFLSEILLQMNELVGFVCYTLLISGILLTLMNLEKIDNSAKLIILFMIFPMIRILELFLHLSFYWRITSVYYLFLFLTVFYFIKFKFEFKSKEGGIGLIILSIFLGVLLGFVVNSFFEIQKSFWFLMIIPIIAFSEELFFRGMIQNLMEKSYGVSYGIILTSIFYAIASLGFGLELFFFFLLLSLILSVIYGLTKNIWLTIIINMIVHVFMIVIV